MQLNHLRGFWQRITFHQSALASHQDSDTSQESWRRTTDQCNFQSLHHSTSVFVHVAFRHHGVGRIPLLDYRTKTMPLSAQEQKCLKQADLRVRKDLHVGEKTSHVAIRQHQGNRRQDSGLELLRKRISRHVT
jgi:hypothetical protein